MWSLSHFHALSKVSTTSNNKFQIIFFSVNYLTNPQTLLVSTSCSAVSLLSRCSGLPLPNSSPKQDTHLKSDNPFNINKNESDNFDDAITKYAVADRLFKIVGNAKLPSKVKEKALYTLGLLCCGERFPFAKEIVKGFLQMAKDVSVL